MRNRFTIDTDLVFHGNNNNSNDSDPSSGSPLFQQRPALLPSPRPQGEDTDRWVEEQFDLGLYEGQGEAIGAVPVKETDILSDDDEYCKSVRAASAEPPDLEGKMKGLDLQGGDMRGHNLNGRIETRSEVMEEEQDEGERIKHGDDSFTSCSVSLSRCATPTLKLTKNDHDVVWVRRDDFANGCNSDVF